MTLAVPPQRIFRVGDTLWSVYGNIQDRLFDSQGLMLRQWVDQGRATLIKAGAGRTIYRVQLPRLELYIKHFRAVRPSNFLHQLVRRGRAEKEFDLIHLLQEHGIRTVNPLALGERRWNGLLLESYLLTEAVPDGIPLFDLIEKRIVTGELPFPQRLRGEFARSLAALAAAIHQVGIEHRDLHEKNIIVQPDGNGRFRFFLLDLHELRCHGPLPWRHVIRELSRLGRYFTLRTTPLDRFRFFRHYAKLRGFDSDRIAGLARQVERDTMRSRADFWRRRDTRPLHKVPRLRICHAPATRALATSECSQPAVRRLMDDPDRPFTESLVRWWKVGRGTRVAEVKLDDIPASGNLVYKQYHFKGWHEAFAAVFYPNQAMRAWKAAGALRLREIRTPRRLLLIEKRRFGMPVTSYLLTERVPDALTITEYLDRHLPSLEGAERVRVLRGVLEVASRLLRKMHRRGVSHRDLKTCNVLASYGEDLARPTLWVIDLDGVQTWHDVPLWHRLQNVTRFHVSFHNNRWISRTDRLRFLRIYLGADFRRPGLWKTYWREIERRTREKILRNLRHGRSVV